MGWAVFADAVGEEGNVGWGRRMQSGKRDEAGGEVSPEESRDDDDEEALSFSNLPVSESDKERPEKAASSSPAKDEHFEFRTLGGAAGDMSSTELAVMCAAEDVFFHGQLLPLGPTQPVSRSDSSASISLDSSSSCVSRSLSSNSCASSSDARPRRRRSSSALYAYPSPSPRVTPVRRNGGSGSGRRSTGSAPPAGWGLLRLGVVMAPEMELRDIRLRRTGGAGPKLMSGGCVIDREKRLGTVWRLLGGGLTGCKCSPEDAVAAKVGTGKKKKKGKERGGIAGTAERRERMFEWLEELSLGKEPLIG
ncbi:hypothetical protein KSP40_PGU009029 [Platanthera guangdongensis]|uniref:Uncharacterized protein n=1 Tax=Platanthera guangdongensis TaxID=2320717 RepID=A0ABR2M724_9ASPA